MERLSAWASHDHRSQLKAERSQKRRGIREQRWEEDRKGEERRDKKGRGKGRKKLKEVRVVVSKYVYHVCIFHKSTIA
jgi:hypothetical protein